MLEAPTNPWASVCSYSAAVSSGSAKGPPCARQIASESTAQAPSMIFWALARASSTGSAAKPTSPPEVPPTWAQTTSTPAFTISAACSAEYT